MVKTIAAALAALMPAACAADEMLTTPEDVACFDFCGGAADMVADGHVVCACPNAPEPLPLPERPPLGRL